MNVGDGSVPNDTLALLPVGIDLIAAFYGCLYAGCVPITVRPPHPQNIATTLPTVKMIVEVMLPGPRNLRQGGVHGTHNI